MKKLIIKNWRVILIFLASFAVAWPLFVRGYFSHHDDLHIIRIFEMRRCFVDLQIPCRWVPDLGNGYGFPMFNYYGVFPYYLGAILSYVLGFIGSAKFLFFAPLVFGGFFVYLFAKELFGKDAGLLAGMLYTLAPYRAVDAYVRGAVTELIAISLMPLVLFFYMRLVKKLSFSIFLGATFSLGIFLLNHNIMTMFFVPILICWLILRFIIDGQKNIRKVLISLILGFGLAAFFLFPAYLETNLIQTENLRQSEFIPSFRAHFVTLKQLFLNRFWGYGSSTWLESDGLSFQLGWPHWWLASGAILTFIVKVFVGILKNKFKFNREKFSEILNFGFIFLVLVLSLFMTHNKSAFIWEFVKPLQYAQFSWRFLGISILAVSVLGSFSLLMFPKNIRLLIFIVFSGLTILFNFKYFKPEVFYKERKDEDYFSGTLWEYQYQGAIYDYLPRTAILPRKSAPIMPVVISGEAEISGFFKYSKSWKFKINSKNDSDITVPVFDFPNWTVLLDGKPVFHQIDNNTGSILIHISKGEHAVQGFFRNTPVRLASNLFSLFCLVFLIIYAAKLQKAERDTMQQFKARH